jgi:hypothetical protein
MRRQQPRVVTSANQAKRAACGPKPRKLVPSDAHVPDRPHSLAALPFRRQDRGT